MNYLALDLGGSSGKLYLASFSNQKIFLTEILKVSNHPVNINGNLYWDILHIYENILEGIRIAIRKTGDKIDSLGFDSFCNDFVIVDENGIMLSPVRCYRDSRTARHQKHMYSIMSPEALYQINGNQNALFNTLPQLHAMNEENHGWMLENGKKILFVSDFFIFCLTGRMVTEYTTASVTQLFDYKKMDWSDTILNSYKINKSLFSELVMPGGILGNTKKEVNEVLDTNGITVTSVCQHDTASAFLASISEGESIIISAGTWSVIGCEINQPIINDFGYEENIANEGGCEGHHRILKNVMGTWILQEVIREKQEKGQNITFSELDAAAAQYPLPDCIVNVDLEKFYSPGNMIQKIEQYWVEHCGRKPQTIGELAASVYLGLVFKYRCTIETIQKFTGKKFKIINILGGGAQSRFVCQKIADVCQCLVEAGPFEATAYGNILMQMLAMKEISSIEEGRRVIRNSCEVLRYVPDLQSIFEESYKKFIGEI